MTKKLVVVESPAKAKTIGKILGPDFVVKSSKGHVRDLPVSRLGLDVRKGFLPQYVVAPTRKKVVEELKTAAKSCDEVYLCPDPDREGEAIAWHLQYLLQDAKQPKVFHRVQYNEITPRAVREAFAQPGTIDMHRVDAQQARRVLDRIVGYMVSPLLWRRIRRGLSAGRVQSVALKLVCDREREIRAFVPEVFWVMGAKVHKLVAPVTPFRMRLARVDGKKAEIRSEAAAAGTLADVEKRDLVVRAIKTREVMRRAPPPFITSSLQQAASTQHGMSPSRTMAIAQRLYEGLDSGSGPVGLITYMRTDSFNVSREAQESCRRFIGTTYGDAYVPATANVFRSRSSAQEAHEAIRPTDVERTPDSLAGKVEEADLKLYTLIWRRFVASQMATARVEIRTVSAGLTGASGADYEFVAGTSSVLFPGYMRVAGVEAAAEKPAKDGEAREPGEELQELPPLAEGERLALDEWTSERKETQPPPRFSEASLVRELERNGVGRPSTYASTVGTLNDREYVTREKRTLMPTDLGLSVNDLLQQDLKELFDVKFTATMENTLDAVERGETQWQAMIEEFYSRFRVWMAAAKGPSADGALVGRVLDAMAPVTEWAAPVARGKRTFSDEKFVGSIRTQWEEDRSSISQRQFEVLLRIAARYERQSPAIVELLKEVGHPDEADEKAGGEPVDAAVRKLDLLEGVELDESTTKFLGSLRGRVTGGRMLSEAQARALNQVVMRHASRIPDFDARRAGLEFGPSAAPREDKESEELLQAMDGVTQWGEAVTKGERTFDDREFHASLSRQFRLKRFLTDRQKAALKRMVARYRAQISDYDALSQRWQIGKRRKDKEEAQADAGG